MPIVLGIILFCFMGYKGCWLVSKRGLFKSACKTKEDCKKFKKNISDWQDELKQMPDYKEQISKEGVDKNENGLRDDIELYIDKYLGLNDRHWMARHPFKFHARLIQDYRDVEPNYGTIKEFARDFERQVNCSSAVFFAEKFAPGFMLYSYHKIEYLMFNNISQAINMRKFYFPKGGARTNLNLQNPALQINIDYVCGISFDEIHDYKDRLFYLGGSIGKRSLEISLQQYEITNGKGKRDRYREYLKKEKK